LYGVLWWCPFKFKNGQYEAGGDKVMLL